MSELGLPTTLDEAIEILITFYGLDAEKISKMTEDEFVGSSHFGAGMFIRNSWYLWWYKGHKFYSWPKEQPELNKWFESIGIVHGDDLSGIILTSTYRKLAGKPIKLDKQVKLYQTHWKKHGYPDGIPKHK